MTGYRCQYCGFEAQTKADVRAHIAREDDADHRDRNGAVESSGIESLGDGQKTFDTDDGHDGAITTEGIDDVLENELGKLNGSSGANDTDESAGDDADASEMQADGHDQGTVSVPRDELLRIEAELWAFEHADEVNVEAALEMLDTRLGELANS